MGRCAVRQRVEEKTEAAAKLFFREAKGFEQALLNVLAVDSNAAGAEFVAVENEVIAFRTDFSSALWLLEQVKVFFNDASKRMLCADPGLVRFAPFEERETSEPEKFPGRWDEV